MNFRWALDVQYVHSESAPLLNQLCERYRRFWDGEFYYMKQSQFVLRWPDWRKNYRVDLEKARNRYHNPKQTQLLVEVGK
jgi:hypothetical protein